MQIFSAITIHFKIAIVAILLITFPTHALFSQNTNKNITARIRDSLTNLPLGDVDVYIYDVTGKQIFSIFKSDSTGFASIIIDSPNDSSIKMDLYKLGYQKKTFTWNMSSVDTMNVYLTSTEKELGNVTVINTPVTFLGNIIRYNLKSVLNVENMTLLDAFDRLPFLTSDEHGVKMMGEPIIILIDDKEHPFYNNSENLNSLPPQAIEKVEVKIVPSARNGEQKVMNLTLKKNYFLGWTGNFNTSVSRLGAGAMGRLGYWSNRFGFTIATDYSYGNGKVTQSTVSNSTISRVNISQSLKGRSKQSTGSGMFSAFYNIDSLNTIDLVLTNSFARNISNKTGTIIRSNPGNSDSVMYSQYHGTTRSGGVGISLNYTRKYHKPDKEFYILTQYTDNVQRNSNQLSMSDIISINTIPFSRQNTTTSGHYREFTVETILEDKISDKVDYTAGAKLIQRWNGSDYGFMSFYNNPPSNSMLVESFTYNQSVYTAYVDASAKLSKQLSLNTGLRYEYVISDFTRKTRDDYSNVIPNLSLTYTANQSNSFALSYTRTLLRPDFNSLLPVSNIQSVNFRDSGNVNLRPQYANRYSAQYYGRSNKIEYGLEVNYTNISNFIDEFFTINSAGVVTRTYTNSSYHDWSLALNISFPISNKIRFSHFSSASEASQRGFGYKNSSLSGYIQERIFFRLAKNQNIDISANAFSPNLTLQGKSQTMAYLNTRLSYTYFFKLHDNPSQFGIGLSNPWLTKGLPSFEKQQGKDFHYYNKSYSANPFINVRFVINFKGRKYQSSSFDRSKDIRNNDLRQSN